MSWPKREASLYYMRVLEATPPCSACCWEAHPLHRLHQWRTLHPSFAQIAWPFQTSDPCLQEHKKLNTLRSLQPSPFSFTPHTSSHTHSLPPKEEIRLYALSPSSSLPATTLSHSPPRMCMLEYTSHCVHYTHHPHYIPLPSNSKHPPYNAICIPLALFCLEASAARFWYAFSSSPAASNTPHTHTRTHTHTHMNKRYELFNQYT